MEDPPSVCWVEVATCELLAAAAAEDVAAALCCAYFVTKISTTLEIMQSPTPTVVEGLTLPLPPLAACVQLLSSTNSGCPLTVTGVKVMVQVSVMAPAALHPEDEY